jgi:hypothetical protein
MTICQYRFNAIYLSMDRISFGRPSITPGGNTLRIHVKRRSHTASRGQQ